MFMITKLLLNMYKHGFHSGHRQLDRGSIHKLVFLKDWLNYLQLLLGETKAPYKRPYCLHELKQ